MCVYINSKTIAEKITLNGIGIHSGKSVSLSILPASPNTGIILKELMKKII